jgi:hypothetical protein
VWLQLLQGEAACWVMFLSLVSSTKSLAHSLQVLLLLLLLWTMLLLLVLSAGLTQAQYC